MESVSNHCNLIVMVSLTLHKDACNSIHIKDFNLHSEGEDGRHAEFQETLKGCRKRLDNRLGDRLNDFIPL